MPKTVGIDLGTTNSVSRSWRAASQWSSPTQEGVAHDALCRRVHQERRDDWWASRPAPGGVTIRKDTIYSIKRFMGRRHSEVQAEEKDGSLRDRAAAPRTGAGQSPDRRQGVSRRQRSRRMILRKLKEAAESLPGREGPQGGHHRPGLLQRQPAAGHQGRRSDRRAGSGPHHQRAHRRCPGLWAGQEEEREDRSCSTSAAAPSTSRSWTWATASSRSSPPTATPTSAATTATRRSSNYVADEFKQGARDRLCKGPDGPAAAQGSGREGQDRAVVPVSRPTSTCRSSRPTRTVPST